MNSIPLKLKPKPWLLAMVAAAVAASGGLAYVGLSEVWLSNAEPEPGATQAEALTRVAALGRLEPAGEIINIAAPLSLDGDRLAELLVQPGDIVKAGEPLAVLDSRDRLQDEVTAAQLQISLADAKLAQVKAGAKQGEVAAQAAEVTQQSAEMAGQLRIQRSEIARIEAQVEGDRAAQQVLVQESLLLAVLGYLPSIVLALGRYQLAFAAMLLPIAMTTRRAVSVMTIVMCSASGAIAMRKLRSADPADIF